MGLCVSSQRRAERMRSLAIDRAIKADNTRLNKEFKVLLLGKHIKNIIQI